MDDYSPGENCIMTPDPYYTADDINSAFHLRYGWTGWPSSSTFPDEPHEEFFEKLTEAWETDGIRLLEYDWTPKQLQFLTSVTPEVAPVTFTARMKGRLDYALRKAEMPTKFNRTFAMRTVGENRRDEVEQYIGRQVQKEGFADPKFEEFLEEFTTVNESVDLSSRVETKSGRYWYNLHVVLTVRDRSRITDREGLSTLYDWSLNVAEVKGYRISALSVMPDHLHLALGGNVEHSPEEIALSFMNNLAYQFGHMALWQPSFYVGSFGEYDMGAVAARTSTPAGQARGGRG